MLTYVCEFNLNTASDEAEKFILEALREWPGLYAELPGVRGTMLLANAFALAGEFTYQWRVDMESFKTLQIIDGALKSDRKEWRKARGRWFEHRSRVRARLLRYVGGNSDYSTFKGKGSGSEGLVHYVLTSAHGGQEKPHAQENDLHARLASVWRGLHGVEGLQHFSTVVQSCASKNTETWARLANIETLDEFTSVNDGNLWVLGGQTLSTQLLGELREVNGVLFSGA